LIKSYFLQNRVFYTSSIIVIIINIFILFFVILPNREMGDARRRDYFSMRNARIEAENNLIKSKEFSSRLETLRADYDAFIENLPEQSGITAIVKKIHALAKKEGLLIKSARYSSSFKQSEEMLRYSISFPLTGNYRSIRKFIYNLEKMPYLMSIDALNITSNSKKTVSVSLDMSLYFREGTV